MGILNWRPTVRTWWTRYLWCWISASSVPLVLDLCIVHDGFGSSSDSSLNGHLHYADDIDKSLNEVVDQVDTDKIRKYRVDYNNNPPNTIFFIPPIVSTSGWLHSEFIRLLFLQVHRETDRFFSTSGVHLVQSTDNSTTTVNFRSCF